MSDDKKKIECDLVSSQGQKCASASEQINKM